MKREQVTGNQMREAKALILRLEQEKKTAIQDMMDNLQTALREKDEAVKNSNEMRQALEERNVQIEEMKKEKEEFFHKMEKQLEESEKRREITELKKEREVLTFTCMYFILRNFLNYLVFRIMFSSFLYQTSNLVISVQIQTDFKYGFRKLSVY